MFDHLPVLIKGAGDVASGVAVRLFRSGFPVVMTEIERPLTVRRSVAFAQAVFDGMTTVEGIYACRCAVESLANHLAERRIPLLVDPTAEVKKSLHPAIVVDGIMAKTNTGSMKSDAPVVITLGPGFYAGKDCHAIVETNRGHNLGRVIWEGRAEPDTGRPGALPEVNPTASRVLRAPQEGYVRAHCQIGDTIEQRTIIATVFDRSGNSAALTAAFHGVLRGIIHPSVPVVTGMKIGDLDPRTDPAHCFSVSDKALAVGGGVLEAILALNNPTNPSNLY